MKELTGAKNNYFSRTAALALCLLPLAAAGCGGNKNVASVAARPDWVMKNAGRTREGGLTVLYGVGIAEKMDNAYAQRKTADLRARAEVVEALKTTVSSMFRDFLESHREYFKNDASSEKEITTALTESVAEATLVNSDIKDRWEDPENGTLYSLVKVDLNDALYTGYKNKVRELINDKRLETTGDNAQKAMLELDAEIERQRGLK